MGTEFAVAIVLFGESSLASFSLLLYRTSPVVAFFACLLQIHHRRSRGVEVKSLRRCLQGVPLTD